MRAGGKRTFQMGWGRRAGDWCFGQSWHYPPSQAIQFRLQCIHEHCVRLQIRVSETGKNNRLPAAMHAVGVRWQSEANRPPKAVEHAEFKFTMFICHCSMIMCKEGARDRFMTLRGNEAAFNSSAAPSQPSNVPPASFGAAFPPPFPSQQPAGPKRRPEGVPRDRKLRGKQEVLLPAPLHHPAGFAGPLLPPPLPLPVNVVQQPIFRVIYMTIKVINSCRQLVLAIP